LDTLEIGIDAGGQGMYGGGLGKPRRPFEQYMPTRDDGDDQALEQALLADDNRFELSFEIEQVGSMGHGWYVWFQVNE
ncbi:MAG: hypothetical protein Q9M29_05325, partial [Mariprofundaceae bacterium]|nr:hypothetical protein [Mariprofundaceae bacterium]